MHARALLLAITFALPAGSAFAQTSVAPPMAGITPIGPLNPHPLLVKCPGTSPLCVRYVPIPVPDLRSRCDRDPWRSDCFPLAVSTCVTTADLANAERQVLGKSDTSWEGLVETLELIESSGGAGRVLNPPITGLLNVGPRCATRTDLVNAMKRVRDAK